MIITCHNKYELIHDKTPYNIQQWYATKHNLFNPFDNFITKKRESIVSSRTRLHSSIASRRSLTPPAFKTCNTTPISPFIVLLFFFLMFRASSYMSDGFWVAKILKLYKIYKLRSLLIIFQHNTQSQPQ